MRSLLLIGLAATAACGNDRALLELTGDFPELEMARDVEVILLEPRAVVAAQRTTDDERVLEPVPYLAQRSSVLVPLDGDSVAGLRLEIQHDGGAYVPLVIVRDNAGSPLAMGIYDRKGLLAMEVGDRALDGIRPVSDVSIYPIELELVGAEEQLIPIDCMDRRAGFVWRIDATDQFRIVLPSPAQMNPLDAPDLDCDQHAAGEPDCDDLTAALNTGEQEQCGDGRDNDCNLATKLGIVDSCFCTPPLSTTCICRDGGRPGPSECAAAQFACQVPAVLTGGQQRPCASSAEVTVSGCDDGCTIVLERAPKGWGARLNGMGLGEEVKLVNNKLTLEVFARQNFQEDEQDPVGDPMLISVTSNGMPRFVEIDLSLDSEDACSSEMTCFSGVPPVPVR